MGKYILFHYRFKTAFYSLSKFFFIFFIFLKSICKPVSYVGVYMFFVWDQ
jgi:hypothetical protein